MARFEVEVGDELKVVGSNISDVTAVQKLADIDERRRLLRQQTHITYGVLAVFALAFAVAALLGWSDGSYDELAAVMAGGGPWAGFVMGRHFKRR